MKPDAWLRVAAVRRFVSVTPCVGAGASLWGALLVALCVAGCASAPPPASGPVRDARFTLTAVPLLNPSVTGQPAPVEVRIYELASSGDFGRANFFELYDDDKRALGQTALTRTVLTLAPGEQLRFTHRLNPKTRQVAILAAYRDIDRAQWRAVADVSAAGAHVLAGRFEAGKVTLNDDDSAAKRANWGAFKRLVMPVWQTLTGAFGSATAQ